MPRAAPAADRAWGAVMGVAWAPDTGSAVVPALPPAPRPAVRPRHRRPTLLSRGSQAVTDRLTALARPPGGVAAPAGTTITTPGHRPAHLARHSRA
jgi:hypothetical protein